MPRGNNQYSMAMGIAKQHIQYDRNVGGLNYGPIDNMIQLFEVADGYNFETAPICAFKKRKGAGLLWDRYWSVGDGPTEQEISSILMVHVWPKPGGSLRTVFYATGVDGEEGLGERWGVEDSHESFRMIDLGTVWKTS